MKVWDVRTYQIVHEYWNPMPATKISISQKGLLSVGWSNQIQVIFFFLKKLRFQIWKDWYGEKQKKPYLKQDTYEGKLLTDMQFVPYEDFLGIGLYDGIKIMIIKKLSPSIGFSSILVPGSGEPNFDSFEVNVFQNKKQRAEDDVSKLLDKVS